jgi:transcriptional regulator with AAA-type ATPase domain
MDYEIKLKLVKERLEKRRGDWAKICRNSGFSINTLQGMLRKYKEPRPSTVDRIFNALRDY